MSASISFVGAAPALLGLLVAASAWGFAQYTRHNVARHKAALAATDSAAAPSGGLTVAPVFDRDQGGREVIFQTDPGVGGIVKAGPATEDFFGTSGFHFFELGKPPYVPGSKGTIIVGEPPDAEPASRRKAKAGKAND